MKKTIPYVLMIVFFVAFFFFGRLSMEGTQKNLILTDSGRAEIVPQWNDVYLVSIELTRKFDFDLDDDGAERAFANKVREFLSEGDMPAQHTSQSFLRVSADEQKLRKQVERDIWKLLSGKKGKGWTYKIVTEKLSEEFLDSCIKSYQLVKKGEG